jgi:hypothetical protein
MCVVEFSGTNGDPEVRKSTLWTPYWESIGSAFLRLGFAPQRSLDLEMVGVRSLGKPRYALSSAYDNLYRMGGMNHAL